MKVQLKFFQSLGVLQPVFADLKTEAVFTKEGAVSDQYELPDILNYSADTDDSLTTDLTEEQIRDLVIENAALRRKDEDSILNYKECWVSWMMP